MSVGRHPWTFEPLTENIKKYNKYKGVNGWARRARVRTYYVTKFRGATLGRIPRVMYVFV